jgi:16S rRNA (guanine527-N7)-methyltransferase
VIDSSSEGDQLRLGAIEAEPAEAKKVFGDSIEVIREFTEALSQQGETLGLIGPLEAARIWTRHVMNCGLLSPLLWKDSSIADVGSGAGLPGLVLAIARPDVSVTLIEPMERRTDWLLSQAKSLGLANVEVLRARAEDVDRTRRFDQVTARAVGALSKLVPITAPLVRVGGELVLMKGASVEAELHAASKVVRKYHLDRVEILELGTGVVAETTRAFRARVN